MSSNLPPPQDGIPEDLGLTLLWGTWELWCDLAPASSANVAAPGSVPAVVASEQQNWLSQVRSIGLFDSAEGFWGLLNCILLPSQLPPNSSFYLFRKHIAPMWEHEANRRGGKWVIPFSHAVTASDAVAPAADGTLPVDVAWQRLCMAVVGEQLPGEEMEICGVTVSRGKVRAGSTQGDWKLCLWTRHADREDSQLAIARYVKELLGLGTGKTAADGAGPSPAKLTSDAGTTKLEEKERENTSLTFMPHRALMEAKQNFSKGTHAPKPFRPLYTV